MMYVIFNNDGSIKEKNINEYIMQGSNNVNKIGVAIDDVNSTDFTVTCIGTLPNGEKVGVGPVDETEEIKPGVTGIVFSLSKDLTSLKDTLKLNIIAIKNDDDSVLVTYTLYLAINPGVDPGEILMMTAQQYESLVSAMLGNVTVIYTKNIDAEMTIADLFDGILENNLFIFKLSGNVNGIYLCYYSKNESNNTFSFEMERFGAFDSYGKERYCVNAISGSLLVDNVLNINTQYYQPYAECKNLSFKFDVDGNTTIEDFYNNCYINGVRIAALDRKAGVTEEEFKYQGYYSIYLSHDDTNNIYYFEFERFAGGDDQARHRWTGSTTPNTTINTILTLYNEYYRPYTTKQNAVQYIGTYDASDNKTVEDFYNWYITQSANNRLSFVFLTTNEITAMRLLGYIYYYVESNVEKYVIQFMRFNPGTPDDRWIASGLSGTQKINDIFERALSNHYYQPFGDLTKYPDYNASTTQTLKNVNGTIKWVNG